GGISFIRVTDNGCGIPKEQIPTAFLRHSTSKIQSVEDLFTIGSLGFRGEALSSIAAVAQVEIVTKTQGSVSASRYEIAGGEGGEVQEVGAPDGTTFLVRNLFYNTPVRRKFLKTPATEGAHIVDLVEKIALSHPEISIRLIQNHQNKLHTSGNHNLKDIIYTVYGREITSNLLEIESARDTIQIKGFVGKPVIARSNRNFENYFINGRYIKSNIIGKAIEEAYRPFMMQHKYPFTLLHISIEPELLDVNVHPTKMELRFQDGELIFRAVRDAISDALMHRELIPEVILEEKQPKAQSEVTPKAQPENEIFDAQDRAVCETSEKQYFAGETEKRERVIPSSDSPYADMMQSVTELVLDRGTQKAQLRMGRRDRFGTREESSPYRTGSLKTENAESETEECAEKSETSGKSSEQPVICVDQRLTEILMSEPPEHAKNFYLENNLRAEAGLPPIERENAGEMQPVKAELFADQSFESLENSEEKLPEETDKNMENAEQADQTEQTEQIELFDGKLLEPKSRSRHKLIGQLFDTYWLVEFQDQLYIIDQHAAHEKVLYEKTMASLKTREYTSQMVSPPIILTLGGQEALMLEKHMKYFTDIGFEIEHFGGREYAVRGVPDNLFSIAKKELLLEMIDGLSEDTSEEKNADMIYEKVASMSCKAAVKGNHQMSFAEADHLIDLLLDLENPYACPHGRPTIISMSRYELEKKFKRIV
uniref:DNA mismatch repair endonuclease MutL n=1 Tax=Brotaphodocola sp. TaxID=3073577 RepID=UPI003D7EBB2D